MAWDTEGTRRRLKEAATEEFAEHGRAGTTMTQIAVRAGINKERLYSYYGDKSALWDVVLAEELDRLASAVALEAVEDIGEIGEFVGATYDFHSANPALARLLQWEGLSREPAARAAQRATHYRQKVSVLAEAQQDGRLDPSLDPDHLLLALIALAAWWQTVPQLGQLVTGAGTDDADEDSRRRAFVVEAARRLVTPR